jgi:hypothetical protein
VSHGIDARLWRAYRETGYRVLPGGPAGAGFTLRIDAPSPELAALHVRLGVQGSAFLTAWNPGSRVLSPAENAARQADLLAAVQRLGCLALPGVGEHPEGRWREESVLVPGLSRDDAESLGRRFGQNAIVWADRDAVPRLVSLRRAE